MRKVILAMLVSMAISFGALAQKTITGKVTDAGGKPMSNVSVVVKGTKVGTTTASDGTYSITVPANGKMLEFSFLNYETYAVNIGSKVSISPSLTMSDAKDMEGVIVTGISKIKKSQFAGAATKIGEKDLKNQPVGSFDQIFQGRAPGVTALTSSGQPGSATNIIIRGTGSIEGGNAPLYIVDGIPVEAGVFQGFNPNDFASVDILRDAASTALYGSRGSAGVIVVTTKKGQAGKIKMGYSTQFGIKTRPEYPFRPMSSPELLKAHEQYGLIVAAGDPFSPLNDTLNGQGKNLPGFYYSPLNPRYASLPAGEKLKANKILDSLKNLSTNWSDNIFRTGNFSNHQITLSGGTGKTRMFTSIGLYNEEGITLRTDMKRATFRNNIDYADDKVSFSVNTNMGYTRRSFQQSSTGNSLSNPFLFSIISVPYAKVYNPDGTFATGEDGLLGSNAFIAANRLDLTTKDLNYNDQVKVTTSISGGYRITDQLTANVTTGFDFRESQNTNYASKLAFIRQIIDPVDNPRGAGGSQSESITRYVRTTVRPSLTYRNTINEKHDFDVSVYGEYIREFNKSFSLTGFGTDPKRPNTMAVVVPANADNQLFHAVGGGKSQSGLLSGLLTGRYTYDNKYTLTASYRQDGSSKLPVDTRWQGFYSIGGIWDATKEDFIKDIKFINLLRVKLSYGGSGNADNFPGGDYPYQNAYVLGQNISSLPTIVSTYPGNPELKWEKTLVTNFGIDYEVLNRRLYGDINIYDKTTVDLFIQKRLSATGGFGTGAALSINAGKLMNRGVEISLNGEIVRKKDLTVTVFANMGYNRNEVVSLGGEQPYESGTELVKEGMPLGSHYEVKWGGVDASTGQPLYYDLNGNLTNVYSGDNRVQQFGTWQAPYRGGFGLNARYKSFELSALLSWQTGATKVDNMEFFVENPVGFMANGYNQSSDLRFWQKPGDVVNTPSPLYGAQFSSKIIHDASFLRFRDLRVAYNLPKNMLNKIKYVSNINLYVQGSNLFIWTKWRGLDPEAGAENINLSEFPNPRTFTAGLDINF
jgi:TonB-linked SusC/RagA family outer membrane protein